MPNDPATIAIPPSFQHPGPSALLRLESAGLMKLSLSSQGSSYLWFLSSRLYVEGERTRENVSRNAEVSRAEVRSVLTGHSPPCPQGS